MQSKMITWHKKLYTSIQTGHDDDDGDDTANAKTTIFTENDLVDSSFKTIAV